MTQAGADLIIGTHPHVPQPVEWITAENGNTALCYYSLGNYVSTQKQTITMLEGMAAVTFTVTEDIQYFEIKKEDVRDVLFDYETFRINYLNLLSRYTQYTSRRLWRCQPDSIIERFNQFVQARSMYPAGRKELQIRMEDLAEELLTTRLRVSESLHQLQSQGLVLTHRGRIEIPALEKMVGI